MRIFDHIHGFIDICEDAKKIIDTPEFQRLRNIKQLGCVSFVFPSAAHNRFEHSLGVYHLSKRWMRILNHKGIKYDKKYFRLISIAALIHDLGHGPYSHLFDSYVTLTNHEYRSIEIFKMMNEKYDFGYSQEDIEFIYNVIYPENLENFEENKYLYQIVSNETGVDIDRMDYMLRDLKMTGIENRYDVSNEFMFHIMEHSVITKLEDEVCYEICYDECIKYSIEMFFATRFNIYRKICHHKTVRSMELMMGEILKLLETTFHTNKSIEDKDWEKFTTYSDNIVSSLDFLSDNSKRNDQAFHLYNRIKRRENYKLVKNLESFVYADIKDINLQQYTDKNKYIINRSIISYYCDMKPKFVHRDNLQKRVFHNFFNDKGRNMFLLKIFKK